MHDGSKATRRVVALDDPGRHRRETVSGNSNAKGRPKRARSKTARSKQRELDQFNTLPEVAASLYPFVEELFGDGTYQMVEPSAGRGAFLDVMPADTIGFDRDVQRAGVLKKDFLKVRIGTDPEKTIVVGNPPFGKACELAIAFFNRAAPQVCAICMIFPATFRKASVQNRLDRHFHLLKEVQVPRNAFEFEGEVKHVPTVFQIWVRRSKPRLLHVLEFRHADFEFTGPDEGDFAIQRIGANAGRVKDNLGHKKTSHYFIKGDVRWIMEQIDFTGVAANTAGCPSLSIPEIIAGYRKVVEDRTGKKRRRWMIYVVLKLSALRRHWSSLGKRRS